MNLIGINSLTLTLDAAQSADIIASWKDNDDAINGANSKIEDSTDETTIVAAPGTGRRRRITDLHIRMPAANTSAVTATIKQSDGTNSWEVFSANMMAGDVMVYDHTRGWHVIAQATLGSAMIDVLKMIYPNQILADSPSGLS